MTRPPAIGPRRPAQLGLNLITAACEMMEAATRSPTLSEHGVGFAGGGGSSEAYRIAGFVVRAAFNHDHEAIAMHRMNHRDAAHYCEDIRKTNWRDAAKGRRFRSMWFSPDCRDFSKAKQGKPKSKRVRGLAWEIIKCINELGPLAPDLIFMENVEEFAKWCTLLPNGKRNPWRMAWLFLCFTGALFRRGYTEIQWAPGDGFVYRRTAAGIERVADVANSGRACDYGAPTIRKRLYLVARRDGKPIVWPEPTHGSPASEGVKSGRLKRFVTFADIGQFELPCPSIFMTRRQARAFYRSTGIRIQRPLARASLKRIAIGVWRHVMQAAEPFLVTLNHGGGHDHAPKSINKPVRTLTAAHDAHGLIAPVLAYGQHGGNTRPATDPVHTIAASSKDTNQLLSVFLYPRYGERPGQEPRSRPATEPLATVVNTANGDTVAAVSLAKLRGNPADHPPGGPVTEPVHTISAGGNHHGVFAAFLAQNNGGSVGNQSYGHPVTAPVSTIAGKGSNQSLVALDIVKYYGAEQDPKVAEPLHTVTTRDRFGLTYSTLRLPPLTPELAKKARRVARFLRSFGLKIEGEFAMVGPFVIVDIGMRMLTPRELFRAQGFPDDYIIDRGLFEMPDGRLVEQRLTGKAQVKMCGNSVSPLHAAAIINANLREPQLMEVAA